MRQLKITQSITNRRESHTLEKYFTEVSGVPMITPEEEVRLAKEIKKGNQDALDKLVRANLRFVVSSPYACVITHYYVIKLFITLTLLMKLVITSGTDPQEDFDLISQMTRGQGVYPTENLECLTIQL